MSWGHAEERKWTEKWGSFIYGISKRIVHLCIEIDKSLQRAEALSSPRHITKRIRLLRGEHCK